MANEIIRLYYYNLLNDSSAAIKNLAARIMNLPCGRTTARSTNLKRTSGQLASPINIHKYVYTIYFINS